MNYPKLPDKVYTFLKWLLILVIPVTMSAFTKIARIWGWNIPVEQIVETVNEIAAWLGIILGISAVTYGLSKKKESES